MKKVSIPISNSLCPQTMFLYGTYREDGAPNFGAFCWFGYCWDKELHVMCCIGGQKLTLDRIRADGVFSANLVSEPMLPMMDYLGSHEGYALDKGKLPLRVSRGEKLSVPILDDSPWTFELQVVQTLPKDDGEIMICRIANVMADPAFTDPSLSGEARMRRAAPVLWANSAYFGVRPVPLEVREPWMAAPTEA